MIGAAAVYLALVNLVTFLTFGHDKQRATADGRRVPEANLLALALVGGSPGALAARRVYRHKTRKQPFSTLLVLIVAAQVGAVIGLLLV